MKSIGSRAARRSAGGRWRAAAAGAAVLALAGSACGSSTSSSSASGSGSGPFKIGILYSQSGSFAASSLPEYDGFKFWVNQMNSQGGVPIGPGKKKRKITLVAYNDQSSPTTAATLYNQLITQDNVDLLVADFGSVLTAPAVTIAKEHKKLLIDPSGSGATFFSKGANPYLVLTSLPVSSVWPKPLGEFLLKLQAKRVAIVYSTNDFDQSQAQTIKSVLSAGGVTPVVYQGVPTDTTDYNTIIQSVKGKNPDAVIELGYQNNDIAFLNDLRSSSVHFPFVLTAFPSQLQPLFAKDVGTAGLSYTFAYGVPPVLKINDVNLGLGLDAFEKAFNPQDPTSTNFLNTAGYNAGLVIQAGLANATSTSQLGIRKGIADASGKLKTLTGTFKIDETGEQLGELLPVAQVIPSSSGGGVDYKIVYPPSQAQTKAVYPAPAG